MPASHRHAALSRDRLGGGPMRLTYPADFPEQSRAKVDIEIEHAEIHFSKSFQRPESFAANCFFAFTTELCRLALATGKTVQAIENDAEEILKQLIAHSRRKCEPSAYSFSEHEWRTRNCINRDGRMLELRQQKIAIAKAIAEG